MVSRRRFLQAGAAGLAMLAARRRAYGFAQTPNLRKFRSDWPLQGLGPNGIPVAASDYQVTHGNVKALHYTIDMNAYTQQLHPELSGRTSLWGYGQGGNHRHLGGVIVAQKDQPIQVTFRNFLPDAHPLRSKIDRSRFFMDAMPGMGYGDNRVSVHLHGGFVPWISDGQPHSWFGPAGGSAGPTYSSQLGQINSSRKSTGSAEYYWPNQQSSRLMWYHDHAMDITRLNAYAGLATGYVLRDDLENELIQMGAIPGREVPLIFQDKTFLPDGQLWYPSVYEPATATGGRWELGPSLNHEGLPNPSCVPEFFGDTILCNGTVYPQLPVIPRRYRFRILNAFQARFMNLTLYKLPADKNAFELPLVDDQCGPPKETGGRYPNPVPHPSLKGPEMIQIGTEGGFLKAPVTFDQNLPIGYDADGNINRHNLVLGPAERADLIVDFSDCQPGDRIILYSDAPAPFPGGDPRNDYFFGQQNFTDPNKNDYGVGEGLASPPAGCGPNTRTLLQFTVGSAPAGTPRDVPQGSMMAHLRHQLDQAFTTLSTQGVPVRELTLNEDFDEWGRLVQRLGTADETFAKDVTPMFENPAGTGHVFGRWFADPVTEKVKAGATEIWRIWNMTGDTHPIHFHLVNVQIVGRQDFSGLPNKSLALPPRGQRVDPNEVGWKETVRINPGEAVSVIMKFDLPTLPFQMPLSNRTGIAGHEYVWHCHILEHEEHDMMRPVIVTP